MKPIQSIASSLLVTELAWRDYRRGDLQAAYRRLQPSVERPARDGLPEGSQGEALQLYGLVLHDLGLHLQAAEAIEKGALVSPLGDDARIALASCYVKLGRIEDARSLYLQLAVGRQLPPDLMLEVASGLDSIGSPQLAYQVCEWVTEKHADFAQAYYDMGFYSARSGNPLYLTEALMIRAIELEPTHLAFRVGHVALLDQMNQEKEALKAFEHVELGRLHELRCMASLNRVSDLLRRHGRKPEAELCDARLKQLRLDPPPFGAPAGEEVA